MVIRFIFFVFVIFIVLFFSSCSKGGENEEIIFWSSSLKPYFTDYIEGCIKNFEELYGIKVVWQDYPLDSVYQKIITTYGSDLSPDVVNVNPQIAAGLYKKNFVVNVLVYDKDLEKNYYGNLIEGCKIYGALITIPWYASTKMLVFNKEIFDFSKVKINDYKGFLEVVKSIKDREGVYGFYPFVKFEQDMLALGLIDSPTDPFNNRVMSFFEGLREYKEYLPSGFLASSVDVAYSMYKDRKVASILIGPQFLYRIKKEDPNLYKSTDVMLFPFPNYPVSLMSLSVLNNRDVKRIENSIKFVRFLTNFENQEKFFEIVPVLPTIQGNYVAKDDDELIRKAKSEMLKVFPKAKVFDFYFYSVIPDPLVRSNIFKNFLNDVFNSQEKLKDIQERYRKIWLEEISKNK